jgi:small subunit ribosomal protein S1
MSWTKRVKHPNEVLRKGDVVKARITNIDVPNQRVSLSIKEFLHDEWDSFVADHRVGDTLEGKVVNVTDFGLFIDIYNGLEGLAHVSEIDVPSGARLEDHFKAGDWVRARILRIEDAERKVGLTMRGVSQPSSDEIAELEASQSEHKKEAAAVREAAVVRAAEEDERPRRGRKGEDGAEEDGEGEEGDEEPVAEAVGVEGEEA